ncbi:MAG: HAMP domain-containing protein [Armatimonadia bacterium]|nr:HAMP domain-containing protein [Armatimonadia bacterium]
MLRSLIHNLPIRTKLLGAMVSVSLLGGILTVVAGGYLLNRLVLSEAERRVDVALNTARAALSEEGERARLAGAVAAEAARDATNWADDPAEVSRVLEVLRAKGGFDYVHLIDDDGVIRATARGEAVGRDASASQMVRDALSDGVAHTSLRLVPMIELSAESPDLSERALIRTTDTAMSREGGPSELRQAMVLEAVTPIVHTGGQIDGAVRVGMMLQRNSDLVDDIRGSIFTMDTYNGRNLGTVTIFQDDVRIATNVTNAAGQRAVGSRVSEEVYDHVMGEGQTWIGPAYVVGTWYVSAYEPLMNEDGQRIGMLYAGVLKTRYDDMRARAMGVFIGIAVLVLLGIAGAAVYSANRIAGPIAELSLAADAVAGGELHADMPGILTKPEEPGQYEIDRLRWSFHEMVHALRERDEKLRSNLEELQEATEELRRWNDSYLNTLEFITHELKNQIAAMKINVLALQGGFVGEMSEDQIEALDDVHASIVRTEEMILNYLNLSRIEKGELEVRTRPVLVVDDVMTPVMRDLRGQFDEKDMTVSIEVGADVSVQADPTLLQIVFENLLGNAAKYGEDSGRVTVTGEKREDGWVELAVRNTGPGVPADQVRELFQKFARVSRPGELERGSGLGLYITREIVRKHGGDIDVRSEEGEWIEFNFTLPRPDVLQGQHLGLDDLDDEEDMPEMLGVEEARGAETLIGGDGMDWLSDDDDDDDGEYPALIGGDEPWPDDEDEGETELIGGEPTGAEDATDSAVKEEQQPADAPADSADDPLSQLR